MMNLLNLIIIFTVLVVLIGCCILSNEGIITGYLEGTNITKYGRYDIHITDSYDANFIRLLFPIDEKELEKRMSDNNKNNGTIPPLIPGSDVSRGYNTATSMSRTPNGSWITSDPNKVIPSDDLLPANANNKIFGNELPWDKEVGFCDVLKNTDKDLYQNVQNADTIVFY